jgi:hypothetical protein
VFEKQTGLGHLVLMLISDLWCSDRTTGLYAVICRPSSGLMLTSDLWVCLDWLIFIGKNAKKGYIETE